MLHGEGRGCSEALAAAGDDRHAVPDALQNDMREDNDARKPGVGALFRCDGHVRASTACVVARSDRQRITSPTITTRDASTKAPYWVASMRWSISNTSAAAPIAMDIMARNAARRSTAYPRRPQISR